MFIGHFAFGYAAKGVNRQSSLGTNFIAAQFIDLLWPFLLLAGIEKVSIDPGNTAFTPLSFDHYPYSHSLLFVALWAALFGLLYYIIKKDRRSALVLAVLVLTHWFLDLLVHRPDLPLTVDENLKFGLGLWNNRLATVILEITLFVIGIYIYMRSTTAIDKIGRIGHWILIALFLAIYFMNLAGDPPPNAEAIGYVGMAQWLFVAFAYWVDKHRKAV